MYTCFKMPIVRENVFYPPTQKTYFLYLTLYCVTVIVFACVQQREEKLEVDWSGQQDLRSQGNRK